MLESELDLGFGMDGPVQFWIQAILFSSDIYFMDDAKTSIGPTNLSSTSPLPFPSPLCHMVPPFSVSSYVHCSQQMNFTNFYAV